jgi:hypothetical protein
MEFIIIAIVIISIFSSLTRQFKKNMKKGPSFDPWSFDSDSPENESKTAPSSRPIPVQEPFSRLQESIDYDSLPNREVREQITPSIEQGKKTREYTPIIDAGEFEKGIKELLTGKRLPLGIVASEVLGPPRANRPYRRKLSQGRFR